jgi:ubiquinone/menaquinone biosynthesis C-methylase UbiE
MLSVARTKLVHRFPLIRGDAMCMPFPGSCFDAVYAITTLEFARDHTKVLEEMYRCLRPGGTLAVGVLNAFSFLGLKRRLFPSAIFRSAHFFTVGELKRCLEPYGKVYPTTCVFLPPYRVLLPVGGLVERIGKTLFAVMGQFIVASVRKPVAA